MDKSNITEILRLLAVSGEESWNLQLLIDACGITIDDFTEDTPDKKYIISIPKYLVKFSIPESWEPGILEDGETIDPTDLKKEFKEQMNKALIEFWRQNDKGTFDENFYTECLQYIKYLCRTRKGETWTIEKRNAALAKTKAWMDAAKLYKDRDNDYEEI